MSNRKLATGVRHSLTVRKLAFAVEIQEPKHGAVFLAGDRIPLKVAVKANGVPVPLLVPEIEVTNGAKLAADKKSVSLPAAGEGTVMIRATYRGSKAEVSVRTLIPVVTKVELVDPDGKSLFNLYDHAAKAAKPPVFEYEAGNAKPKKAHPGAMLFNRKLKAKIFLGHPQLKLTKATKGMLAIETPALDDKSTPKMGEYGGRPIVFMKETEIGTDWTKPVEVESDRPLPFAVRAYNFKLDPRLRVKSTADGSFCQPEARGQWVGIPPVEGVEIFAIWGAPKVGNGTDYDAKSEPLKQSEFDPFHVRNAVKWAEGTWNLLLEDKFSIPFSIDNKIRHYAWPEGYEGKDGKAANAHAQPSNLDRLRGNDIYYSNGKACGNCGGTIDWGGACQKCGRKAATDLRCQTCKIGLEDNARVCGTDRKYVARFVGGALKCANCQTSNGVDVFYDAGSLTYFDGRKLAEADRAKLKPLDHCTRCKNFFVRIEAKCPSCNQFAFEGDILSGKHNCPQGAKPTMDVDEQAHFTGKNWGCGVLDNPTNPGGRCNQQASCIAAFLNLVGVKARVLYIRARGNGALSTSKHDPLTRGAKSFDFRADWGWNFHGIVFVPVDTSRDSEASGVKLHEDKATAYDGSFSSPSATFPPSMPTEGRKRCVAEEAVRTGHDMKKWDQATEKCRVGHPMKSKPTWMKRPVAALPLTVSAFEALAGDGQGTFYAKGLQYPAGVGVQIIKVTAAGQVMDLGVNHQIQHSGGAGIAVKGSQIVTYTEFPLYTGRGGKILLLNATPGLHVTEPLTLDHAPNPHSNGTGAVGPVVAPDGTIYFYSRQVSRLIRVDSDSRNTQAVFRVPNGGLIQPSFDATLGKILLPVNNTIVAVTPTPDDGRDSPGRAVVICNAPGARYAARDQASGDLFVVTGATLGVQRKGQQMLEPCTEITFGNPVGLVVGTAGPGRQGMSAYVLDAASKTLFEVFEVKAAAGTKDCPECGAQPQFTYKCGKCGKPVGENDKGKHTCGAMLDPVYAASLIFVCPNAKCAKTVHENEPTCWNCGTALPARQLLESPY